MVGEEVGRDEEEGALGDAVEELGGQFWFDVGCEEMLDAPGSGGGELGVERWSRKGFVVGL